MNELEKSIEVLQCIRVANSNMIACANYKEIFGDAIDTAIAVLEAQQVNRWIPCEEKLPEDEKDVLATYKGGNIGVDFRHGGEWFWEDEEEDYVVTAWRPLPEPYDPLAEKIQKVLDREYDRISGR